MQTIWIGNGQATAQVDTITITVVPALGGGVLSATINGKTLSYTTLSSDTTSTAASAWQAILASSLAPPEFAEIQWTASTNIITATCKSPGLPFTLATSSSGGATISQSHTTVNSSPSDVNNPANWLRGGSPSLPQDGDDVIVANSIIPLLYNLDALVAVRFNTFTRWQDFQATIGLPEINPAGYYEYRPTYFQFSGPAWSTLIMTLGQGVVGTGPGRERYNIGSQLTKFIVIQSGQALDNYSIRLLGSNTQNIIQQVGSSIGYAMLPGEIAALATAIVDGGGTLALGPGVTYGNVSGFSGSSSSLSSASLGAVTCLNGTLDLFSAPGSVVVDQGSQAIIEGVSLSYPSIILSNNSLLTYISNSTIGNLLLQTGSILDKSGDVQPMTILQAAIDATCQVLDPNNCITWAMPIPISGAIQSGIFTTGRGRKVQII